MNPLTTTFFENFRFNSLDVRYLLSYKLPDYLSGNSGFSQVGCDIFPNSQTFDHVEPRYVRLNASYIVQSPSTMGFAAGAAVLASGTVKPKIGYLKVHNTGVNDNFAYSFNLSGQGNTLEIGVSREYSSSLTRACTDSGAVYWYYITTSILKREPPMDGRAWRFAEISLV